jgi:hypothetical protein
MSGHGVSTRGYSRNKQASPPTTTQCSHWSTGSTWWAPPGIEDVRGRRRVRGQAHAGSGGCGRPARYGRLSPGQGTHGLYFWLLRSGARSSAKTRSSWLHSATRWQLTAPCWARDQMELHVGSRCGRPTTSPSSLACPGQGILRGFDELALSAEVRARRSCTRVARPRSQPRLDEVRRSVRPRLDRLRRRRRRTVAASQRLAAGLARNLSKLPAGVIVLDDLRHLYSLPPPCGRWIRNRAVADDTHERDGLSWQC